MEDQDQDQVIIVEKRYVQIIHLDEDGSVATLKDWAEGSLDISQGTLSLLSETTRTIIKVRWAEDAEIIRDGLMKEDQELFCTVYKIMEKEVMVNFQLKLKDPPILKMPDLVMDMIFSSPSLKDLLNYRLVCPQWGFDNLPIQRVFRCKSLSFDGPSLSGTKEVLCEPYKLFTEVSIDIKNLPAMIEASLFENLEKLEIYLFHDPQLPALLEKIHKTKELIYKGDKELEPENWVSTQKFIANNQQHLESVRIYAEIPEDTVKLDIFENSTSLKSLQLLLSSTEVSWIATNLTELVELELHVKHAHYEGEEEEEDELKESMMADIVSNHPTLQIMHLGLGSWIDSYEYEEMCEEVWGIKTWLEEQLRTKGWEVEVEDPFSLVERLSLKKVGYQQGDSYYDDWM